MYKTDEKGCALLSCDIEAFVMNIFGHFSVSSKCAKEINEVSGCLELEGESALRQAPSRSCHIEDVDV